MGIYILAAQQHRALSQGTAGFMHAHRRHIGPGGHGGNGHIPAEIEMGPVGFVHQHPHSLLMGRFGDGLEIGTNTVIGGIVDQNGLGTRMALHGGAHIAEGHSQGNAQAFIALGVDIHRRGAAEHQGVDDALVHIPGQDDLVPFFHIGEHHGLYRRGGASHHKEGMGCSESVGGQLFGLSYHAGGVAQVIQGLHGVYIH